MKIYKTTKRTPTIPDDVNQNLSNFGLGPLTYEYVDSLPITPTESSGLDDKIQSILRSLFFVAPKRDLPKVGLRKGCWLKLSRSGQKWIKADTPSGLVGYLDTETMGLDFAVPLMAVIATSDSVYCYISEIKSVNATDTVSKIPLGTGNLFAGYNVSFDRAMFDISYDIEGDDNQWVDLLSVNQSINGYSNQQRALIHKAYGAAKDRSEYQPEWIPAVTLTNSLSDVCKFYNIDIDKSYRDNIMTLGMSSIWKDNVTDTLQYCYHDVVATSKLGQVFIPIMRTWEPEVVMGLIERNREIVTLDGSFADYYSRNESLRDEIQCNVESRILQVAKSLLAIPESERTEQQRELDWTLLKSGPNRGLPKWFVEIKKNPSLSVRDTGYILGVKYRGLPVMFRKYHDSDGKLVGHWFYGDNPVPHPETGKPISNLFVKKARYECDNPEIANLISDIESLTNWKNIRKSVEKIDWVYKPDGALVSVPKHTAFGTISRRKNGVWMTLPNPKPDRIGTESRMLIQAPSNKTLVTFDVDSEEALIAALIGDCFMGTDLLGVTDRLPGACPFSYSTILGKKETETDIHSIMAKRMGISRSAAKTAVYGAIYGQGEEGCINTLYQSGLSDEAARIAGKKFNEGMRGKKTYRGLVGGMASALFNGLENLGDKSRKSLALGFKVCNSLRQTYDYATTRRNWIIQATGSDILDIILSDLKLSCNNANIHYRLVMTHHDCISVLCDEADAETVAVILAKAHMRAWLAVCDGLGIKFIPYESFIPSSVEIGRQYKHGESPTYKVNLPVKSLSKADLIELHKTKSLGNQYD